MKQQSFKHQLNADERDKLLDKCWLTLENLMSSLMLKGYFDIIHQSYRKKV